MKTAVKMTKPINKIFAHPKNPRLIRNEKYLEQKKSIEETPEMMDLRPVIIDEDDVILGGHQRWRACKELGWKDVPVMQYTREKHLKSESFTKFNKTYELVCAEIVIKDNTHYGEFDYDILANEWDYLPLTEYGVAVWETEPEEVEGLTDEDEVPEAPQEPITKLGDVWILGEHRVMCGDSTSKEAVEILMDGEKADMVFTDPPYNIDFKPQRGTHDKILNDDMSDDDFSLFLDGVFNCCFNSLKPDTYVFVWCGWSTVGDFKNSLNNFFDIKALHIWVKNNFGIGYYSRPKYEPFFLCLKGKPIKPAKAPADVWEFAKVHKTIHSCEKPVGLIIEILNTYDKNGSVLDLFLGSGSTLIAAEKTKRKCYGMELDPKYCDVIIKRWEDFTGKKAHLKENEFEVITQAN